MSRPVSAATSIVLGLTVALGAFPLPANASDPAGATGDSAKAKRLHDYQARTRALPGVDGHAYQYATNKTYWSVVAVDPHDGADVDLSLYDDRAHNELLVESRLAGGLVDFIAVDSNHRELGSYFPRAWTYSGSGSYTVQLAQGDSTLGATPQTIAMAPGQIAAVRDTLLIEGTTYRFTLTPDDDLVDGALYLMDSLPLTVDTWVKPKSDAMDSDHSPPGEPLVVEVTVPRTDWYGLVITNEGAAGSFDLRKTTL